MIAALNDVARAAAATAAASLVLASPLAQEPKSITFSAP